MEDALTAEWQVVDVGTGRRHLRADGGWSLCGSVPTGYANPLDDTVLEQDVVDRRVRNLCGRCTSAVTRLARS